MGLADGPSGYPKDWYDRSKKVKHRDGYECQICNAGSGTELHVHHIVPKSQGGSHDPSNLLTLCWSCHNDQHEHEISRMKPTLSAGGNLSGSAAGIPKTEGEWKEGESPTDITATGNLSEHGSSVPQPNANDVATNATNVSAVDQASGEKIDTTVTNGTTVDTSSTDTSNPTASVSSQNGNPSPGYLNQFYNGLVVNFILLIFAVGNILTALAVEMLLFRSAERSISIYVLSVLIGFTIFSTVFEVMFGSDGTVIKGMINDFILLLIFVGAVCIPAIGLWIIVDSIVWFYIGATGGLLCVTLLFGRIVG